MKKAIAILLALMLMASIAACAQNAPADSPSPSETPSPSTEASASPEAAPSDTSFTITDMTGRETTFDKPAERIVALTASDCEILYALGAGDTVVGRGEYCDYPEAVLSVPSVQSGYDTNIEQIIALDPDVVMMSTMAQSEEQIASLENAGINVIVSDALDIEGVYTTIELIGDVVGKKDAATSVIDQMKTTFETIKGQVQTDGTKTIYFEVSPLQYGLWAAGSGTFMDEIAIMLGLTNVFGDMESWVEISEEQVIARNPDYIVTTTMSYEGAQNPIDEIKGRQGWGDITAITTGQVMNADSNAITRPGPRLAEAAEELYSFIYGG